REVDIRRASYPPPHDLTLIPARVDRPIRGVTDSILMLHQREPLVRLEPEQQYVFSGTRSQALLPPKFFPEMWPADLTVVEYVEIARAATVTSAEHDMQWLTSLSAGGAIVGSLRMQSYGDLAGPPLKGARLVVSAGARTLETTTGTDGSFSVYGLPAG